MESSRPETLNIVALWAGAMAILFAGMAVLSALGVDLNTLTRDANEVTDSPVETGALSRVTIILWGAAAAGAGATALIARRAATRTMFGLLALILFGLALDDGLLIHEAVLPKLGLPEELVLALWAAVAGLWVLRYGEQIRGTSRLLGLLAAGAFAASLAVDMLTHADWVEDLFKLLGVATLVVLVGIELRAAATANESPGGSA
jgi:hypothetical protein